MEETEAAKGRVEHDQDHDVCVPTQEQIAERAATVRLGWSERETFKRAALNPDLQMEWYPPGVLRRCQARASEPRVREE